MEEQLETLLVIAIIAAAAPLLVQLPRNVRIPVVVVEIIAGIVVGPHVLDIAGSGDIVIFLSNVGLAFLFFLAGMEIDFDRIRGRAARLAGGGWAISLVLGFAIAAGLMAIGFVNSILLIGVALCHHGARHPDADPERRRRGRHAARDAHDRHRRRGRVRAHPRDLAPADGAAGPGPNAALLLAFAIVAAGIAVLALRVRSPAIVRTSSTPCTPAASSRSASRS